MAILNLQDFVVADECRKPRRWDGQAVIKSRTSTADNEVYVKLANKNTQPGC